MLIFYEFSYSSGNLITWIISHVWTYINENRQLSLTIESATMSNNTICMFFVIGKRVSYMINLLDFIMFNDVLERGSVSCTFFLNVCDVCVSFFVPLITISFARFSYFFKIQIVFFLYRQFSIFYTTKVNYRM